MPRPRSSDKAPKAPRKRGLPLWLRRTIAVTLVIGLMGGLGLATGIGVMLSRIPPVDELLAARPKGETQVLDRNGKLIASIQNGENRKLVPLAEIAESVQHAVIASEDIRFYHHWGVDPKGVARAVLSRGKAGGGSTLTQQLAKNLFLSADQTLTRKLADMWLALQLERTLPKEKILEMYLNQVYFGHGAYGVEAASMKYFGKKARALNIAESALLSGLLPAPEYYSPYNNMEAAKERQRIVLRLMVEAGYIDAATAEKEAERKLAFANTPNYAYRAPFFTSHVLTLLSERLGQDLVMRGGLKIHTTVDLALQEAAEGIMRKGVAAYRGSNVGQGALVSIDPATGGVLALVGGTDFDKSQFNRATQAKRQPGSTFKPFVYVTAFQDGFSPFHTIEDEPTNFGSYAPQNYDRRFRGSVTLERALASSLNVPAVKIANTVGINRVIETAHATGIKSDLPANLSLALGSAEVTPLELASAYATFAGGGVYNEAHVITRVEDAHGNLLDQFVAQPRQVIDERAVRSLNHCLQAVVQYGSGRGAAIGRPVAGKTGTTDSHRDTWFAGYTPDVATVVWLGNDDNSRLGYGATGGGLAAPLWSRFMTRAHAGLPVRGLPGYAGDAPASGAIDGLDPASGEAGVGSGAVGVEATPTPEPVLEIGGVEVIEGEPLPEALPSTQFNPATPMPVPTPAPTTRVTAPQSRQDPAPVPSIIIIQ